MAQIRSHTENENSILKELKKIVFFLSFVSGFFQRAPSDVEEGTRTFNVTFAEPYEESTSKSDLGNWGNEQERWRLITDDDCQPRNPALTSFIRLPKNKIASEFVCSLFSSNLFHVVFFISFPALRKERQDKTWQTWRWKWKSEKNSYSSASPKKPNTFLCF